MCFGTLGSCGKLWERVGGRGRSVGGPWVVVGGPWELRVAIVVVGVVKGRCVPLVEPIPACLFSTCCFIDPRIETTMILARE